MPRACWLAFVGLLFVPPALARPLTVEEAAALALEHSHTIEAAEAGELKARAELHESFLQFFPKLTASAGYTHLDQVPYVEFDTSAMLGTGGGNPCEDIDASTLPAGWTPDMAAEFCTMLMGWLAPDPSTSGPTQIAMGLQDNYFAKVSVEQIVFAGGALHQSYAASKDFHHASAEQVRLARQQTVYSTQSGFYQLILARSAVEVTAEAEATVGAYVSDLQAVVDVGAGSRADLLAAKAQHAQAKLDAMRTAHGATLAEKVFKVNLGLPLDEPLELVLDARFDLEDLPAARDDLLTEALLSRPDLAGLDANIAALRHLGGAAWASWLPSLVVMGNVNWKNPNYSNEPEWYRSADITLAASWTLWDRGAALQRSRAARAGRAQLESQRALFAEMLAVEIEAAISTFDESIAELEVARMGVEASEEAHRLERERFEQGMSNNTQLLSAQAALSGARLSLLQAETQMRISHAALHKAVGVDPEVTP